MGYTEIFFGVSCLGGGLQMLITVYRATTSHSHSVSGLIDDYSIRPSSAFHGQTFVSRGSYLRPTLLKKSSKSPAHLDCWNGSAVE